MTVDTDNRSEIEPLKFAHVRAITVIDQIFFTQGRIPTDEEIAAKVGVEVEEVKDWMVNRQFVNALRSRGIDLSLRHDPEYISAEQAVAAALVCNTEDRRSLSEKLSEINVTMPQWEGWISQPRFRQYLRQRAVLKNDVTTTFGFLKLDELVQDGDFKAVEMQMRMANIYRPTQDVNVNVQALIVNVLEIIQKHVHDPETLQNIADDLEVAEQKALASGS